MLRPATVPLTVPQSGAAPVTVEAQLVAPGLFIHPTPEENRPLADQWRLTHHSGRLIGYFPTETQARQAGFIAAQLADWTRSVDELVSLANTGEVDLYQLSDIVRDCGGVFLRRRDTAPTT